MSTWHQSKNTSALMALWSPHPTKWKCVSDRFDRPASCMTFDSKEDAEAYALKTGDVVIAPRAPNAVTS